MPSLPRDTLSFPVERRSFLENHLPPNDLPAVDGSTLPLTTLTFATSLDSQLTLSPGTATKLSGPQSKALTHYLRSRHDAILIGVGTAIADNPSLNCRLDGVGGYGGAGLAGQPRPIIVDPAARWDFTAQHMMFQLAREGKGRAPYIITSLVKPPEDKKKVLEDAGGRFITVAATSVGGTCLQLHWKDIFEALSAQGLRSVMVEGGGAVINSLLRSENSMLVNSVILTIAPTWLGVGGVVVSPPRRFDDRGDSMAAARLDDVAWYPLGDDVVLCGKLKTSS